MKRVKKFTSKHVIQMRKDASKAYAINEKINRLKEQLHGLEDGYRWTSYTDGTVMENLTSRENMDVCEYLDYIKHNRN